MIDHRQSPAAGQLAVGAILMDTALRTSLVARSLSVPRTKFTVGRNPIIDRRDHVVNVSQTGDGIFIGFVTWLSSSVGPWLSHRD